MIGDMSYGGVAQADQCEDRSITLKKKTKIRTNISPLNVNTYCRSEDGGLVQVGVFLYKHS